MTKNFRIMYFLNNLTQFKSLEGFREFCNSVTRKAQSSLIFYENIRIAVDCANRNRLITLKKQMKKATEKDSSGNSDNRLCSLVSK